MSNIIELTEEKYEFLKNSGLPINKKGELSVSTLEELKNLLQAYEDLVEKQQWAGWIVEYVKSQNLGLEFIDDDLVFSELPNFGGKEPANTYHVWSWDENNLLVTNIPSNKDNRYKIISRFHEFIGKEAIFTVKTEDGRTGYMTYPDYNGQDIYAYHGNIQFEDESGNPMGFNGRVVEVSNVVSDGFLFVLY